jgi:hypothetical protein
MPQPDPCGRPKSQSGFSGCAVLTHGRRLSSGSPRSRSWRRSMQAQVCCRSGPCSEPPFSASHGEAARSWRSSEALRAMLHGTSTPTGDGLSLPSSPATNLCRRAVLKGSGCESTPTQPAARESAVHVLLTRAAGAAGYRVIDRGEARLVRACPCSPRIKISLEARMTVNAAGPAPRPGAPVRPPRPQWP